MLLRLRDGAIAIGILYLSACQSAPDLPEKQNQTPKTNTPSERKTNTPSKRTPSQSVSDPADQRIGNDDQRPPEPETRSPPPPLLN